ncbi:helix-turn-helix transcriptional regulator [Limibacter armeniacum]|uniref:helix-turn-helix domain-containing protein n=1 Tax=Limibacter armeniacum TaxID=466084 RepID=UPI002FE55AA8
MSISNRITQFMIEKELTVDQLARELNCSLTTIYDWRKGRSAPKLNNIIQLFEIYPDLNVDWLVTGRGEMLITEEGIRSSESKPKVEEIDSRFEKIEKQLESLKSNTDPFLAMFQMLNQMAKNNGMKLTMNADDQPANRQSGKLAGDTEMSEAEKEIESLNYWVEEYPKRNHNVAA